MDDFKSYTLSRQTPRGQVIKRLLLAGLFLVLLAAGFLYLITTENEPKAPSNTPQPSATTPQNRVIAVLSPLRGTVTTCITSHRYEATLPIGRSR
jgi:hypothetical protein